MDEEAFVCEEMKKFRDALESRGIPWNDFSIGGEFPMCVTKFKIRRTRFSVINGYGSYGGYSRAHQENHGLLEVMRNSNEPKGYLTAEEALEYCGIGGDAYGKG